MTPAVKNQLRGEGAAGASERCLQTPLGITAIGLYMLFGACLMPINIYRRAPAFLMGIGFSGWKATVFFVALGTLDAGIGIGLLRLASWSRIVAIYFFPVQDYQHYAHLLASRQPFAI